MRGSDRLVPMSWDEAFAHRHDVRAGKLDEHPSASLAKLL